MNKKTKDILELINKYKEPNHFTKLSNSISGNLSDIINKYHKLGQAYTTALILECFYDNKHNLSDLKTFIKNAMNEDKELKEYVYECMKDF